MWIRARSNGMVGAIIPKSGLTMGHHGRGWMEARATHSFVRSTSNDHDRDGCSFNWKGVQGHPTEYHFIQWRWRSTSNREPAAAWSYSIREKPARSTQGVARSSAFGGDTWISWYSLTASTLPRAKLVTVNTSLDALKSTTSETKSVEWFIPKGNGLFLNMGRVAGKSPPPELAYERYISLPGGTPAES